MAASRFELSPTLPVRWSGAVLQVLGVLVVANGIVSRERHFRRPGAIRRLLGVFQNQTHTAVGTMSGSVTLRGHGVAVLTTGPHKDIQARVTDLEAAVEAATKRIGEEAQKQQEATRKVQNAVADERAARASAVIAVQDQMEALNVGELHVEKTGLWWLFFGILFSGFPDEIAALLRWLV